MLSNYKNAKSIAQDLIEELKRELKDYINTASNETQRALFNQYCESNGYYDDRAVSMDELEYYLPANPMDIVRMIEGSIFNSSDNFFSFDGYGNLYSYNYIENNKAFCLIDILEWLIDSGERTEEEEADEILDDIEAIENLMI